MNQNILLKYNAKRIHLKKGEFIFKQGEIAHYFYYVVKGKVKVYTLSEDGKEFAHKMFSEGDAVGIPPLFINQKYPSNAVALKNVEFLMIKKADLIRLLNDNPIYYQNIITHLCELLYYKSVMSSEISMHSPEHRILTLFDHMKTKDIPEEINLTRQQVANLTALRVETVIRHIKSLEEQGILKILNRKVYY